MITGSSTGGNQSAQAGGLDIKARAKPSSAET
jgi:hypothetical protein